MTSIRHRKMTAIAVTLGIAVSACGGSQSGDSPPGGAANGTDRAFAEEMIPHHRSAVDMARIAADQAEHPEIKALAGDIAAMQTAEVAELENAVDRFRSDGVEKVALGVPDHATGMDADSSTLADAKPFDRRFIDTMITHHQGAIRMAQLELKQGGDAEMKRMARTIVDNQTREIDQLNMWRVDWYGRASPSGGVPAANDTGMHHDMG